MKLERTQTKAIESEDGENIYIEILDHVEYETCTRRLRRSKTRTEGTGLFFY